MRASGNQAPVETLDPNLTAMAALTTGLGAAMAWLGTRMGLLELRFDRRRCPSCGHTVTRPARCSCTR
jgi:hypothetical protein